jgi:hypothetical protein
MKRRSVDVSGFVRARRFEQPIGPDETADVFNVKWRLHGSELPR